MSDPWHILGLSRDSATEKDVKAAYARLIRQHRPDTDPEGFQRVRQAYESALASLKNRGEGRQEVPPLIMPPSPASQEPSAPDQPEERERFPASPLLPESPPPSAPPELAEAELAVFTARDKEGPQAMDRAIARLYSLCRNLRPGKAGFQLWYESLHRVTEGRSMLVARGVTILQLTDEMEAGSALISHAVVAHWEAVRNIERLHALAEAMMAKSARLSNRESAVVALRVAMEIGFAYPRLAGTLVTFAFPNVDRKMRDQIVPQVEHQAAIGTMMAGLRSDQISFWHERLRHPNQTWDWSNKASQDALEYLAKRTPPQWNGFGIVRQIAPPDWLARLEQAMTKRPTRPIVPPPLSRPRLKTGSGGGKSMGRSVWLVVFLLINLVRVLPDCTGQPRSSSSPPIDRGLRASGSRPASSPNAERSRSGEAPSALANLRVEKLLKEDNVLRIWVEGVHGLAVPAQAKINGAAVQDRVKISEIGIKSVKDMILQFHKTNPVRSRERRLQEALLFSQDSTSIEILVALEFMSDTQTPDAILPLWEEAVRLRPRISSQVAAAAAVYLRTKGSDLLNEERERMQKLADMPH